MKHKSKTPAKNSVSPAAVLALLREREGWRSGEEVAEMLGVSRAAVAKHIAALRREGHCIASATNRGYRLLVYYEPVDFALVKPFLKTRILGKKEWRSLDVTSSTNTDAITWALCGGEEGSVVTAERQSHGKGRKGDDWFSSPHGLQFSVILRSLSACLDERAIIHAALFAMQKSIGSLTRLPTRIKEPNDLYFEEKKIGGVLIESGTRAGEPDWLTVGIGCNVNVMQKDFPESIRDKVTSLYESTGAVVSKNRLLGLMLTEFEARLRAYPAIKPGADFGSGV